MKENTDRKQRISWLVSLSLFVGGILGLALYVIIRSLSPAGPVIVIEGPRTEAKNSLSFEVSLPELKALPQIEREGSYQNQYGNFRDCGLYRGVPLTALIEHYFPGTPVSRVVVIGADGYQAEFSGERLSDPNYPVVVAYSLDGCEPRAWSDGPRIAVLPLDGEVTNEEYGAESAGSFWVKNIVRIVIQPTSLDG